MGYWGWRPLVMCAFISVWVAACNIVSDAAPSLSPTPSPRVTLTVRRLSTPTPVPATEVAARVTPSPRVTPPAPHSPTPRVYAVQAGDTLGDLALRFGVGLATLEAANEGMDARNLQPGQQIVIPAGPSAALTVGPTIPPMLPLAPPTCYETPAGSLLCLGSVDNTLDYPLEQAVVRVEVSGWNWETLGSIDIEIEQAMIPPGEFAPYRALFEVDAREVSAVSAELVRADIAQDTGERFVPIEVEDDEGTTVNGRYVVSAVLVNPGPDSAQSVRVVVTLRDDADQIVGYRVAQAGSDLQPGERLPIHVEIVAEPTPAEPHYTLYVEARRGTS